MLLWIAEYENSIFFHGRAGQKGPYCIALVFANACTINSAPPLKREA
jgi:hypothetical protein